jgi:AcrR family transcriptional regulator
MVQTKEKICAVARKLFNERGYSSVTLRDIADAADTTLGNLTYHFNHKIDLINAIQEGPNSVHSTIFRSANLTDNNVLLEIVMRFYEIQSNENDAIYYFRNMIELWHSYQSIAEKQLNYRKDMFSYFKTAIRVLRRAGLLREEFPEESEEILVELIVFTVSLWYQNGSPTTDGSMPGYSVFDVLHTLLFPYLTKNGQGEFIQLCTKLRNDKDKNTV